jgi:hypothetical protein
MITNSSTDPVDYGERNPIDASEKRGERERYLDTVYKAFFI